MLRYHNPVYAAYFADPFVLHHAGRYYAYGTSPGSPDGHQFVVLSSPDLAVWQPEGWALHAPPGIEWWAPEVAFIGGQFIMYYSARGVDGNDHQLRAAVSASPLGPFRDTGRVLVADQPFSIDPHPFQDADGGWYLYYCRDFLTLDDPYRVGTGIVVDKLIDPFTLAGDPRVVVRPFADWHLFKAGRSMYGSVYDWHTVEGAAVRRHNGRVYCFYSGGAWEQDNYGIAYVVADHPLGTYQPPADQGTPLMQTRPGRVIGPGHHSFVTAPDGRTLMCVYHAWDVDRTARRMHIDPMTWDGDTPVMHGPTDTPQTVG
ncbi:MAG: glycoside hydrolase family 43 protein [bacterium]|nr:glycoside hydrolase family 43 protein [bacterium]